MKYENARDILPDDLLKAVMAYAAGKLLYVPTGGKRKVWGEISGARGAIRARNREIRRIFAAGETAEALGERYFLTPETIRKIVYEKKEETAVELKEILSLYSDNDPVGLRTVFEMDETSSWGETYFIRDLEVDYPEKKILLRIEEYFCATPERVAEEAKMIEAYADAGYPSAHILPNRYGETSRRVEFEGHPCLVFAEEWLPFPTASRDGECGARDTPVWYDGLLRHLGKIGKLRLRAKEPCYAILFDRFSACEAYGDWIVEYLFGDMEPKAETLSPMLRERFEKIRTLFLENREKLESLWEKLPSSFFQGYEGKSDFYLKEDGGLLGFRGFEDGGRDVCLSMFLNVILAARVSGGEDAADREVFDPAERERTLALIRRDLSIIREEYEFTSEEIEAAPYLYRVMLFGRNYYYQGLFRTLDDPERIPRLFDYIETQMTSDEIGFREILA